MKPSKQAETELWDLGDQRWTRNPDTGAFELIDFKNLKGPAPGYDPQHVAAVTGSRVSYDPSERMSRSAPLSAALYPGQFTFSPLTGKKLPEPPAVRRDVWLAPFGGNAAVLDNPLGLRQTAAALSLRSTLTTESRPDVELRLPPAGNYRFIIGAFKTCDSRLLAIEFSKGLIYCWLASSTAWVELAPTGSEILGESGLGENAWGVVAPDLLESTRMFLPTDRGLAVVSINLVALTYDVKVVGGRCVGAPALWHGRVYIPMQGEDRKIHVYWLHPDKPDVIHLLDSPTAGAISTEWIRPLIDRRRVIWMSSCGQLLVKQTGAEVVEVSFIFWKSEITPRFDLGSVYLSGDGHLWQQCFEEDAYDGRFVFVQLGRREPEIRPISSPRLSSGTISFKLETLLKVNPWDDPEEDSDSHADEIIIPLLESRSRSTLLCARVPSTSSVDSLFTSTEAFTVTFELRGEQEVRFWVARITRPWVTRTFVYAGRLHLYHPDMRSLPGWRLSE